MAKFESSFQKNLKKELKKIFPGCRIHKMDCTDCQGVPDLLILYKKKWALLECKRERTASKRANQEYWVDFYNNMSFARFIYPENKEEILHELQQAFGVRAKARIPKS